MVTLIGCVLLVLFVAPLISGSLETVRSERPSLRSRQP